MYELWGNVKLSVFLFLMCLNRSHFRTTDLYHIWDSVRRIFSLYRNKWTNILGRVCSFISTSKSIRMRNLVILLFFLIHKIITVCDKRKNHQLGTVPMQIIVQLSIFSCFKNNNIESKESKVCHKTLEIQYSNHVKIVTRVLFFYVVQSRS